MRNMFDSNDMQNLLDFMEQVTDEASKQAMALFLEPAK